MYTIPAFEVYCYTLRIVAVVLDGVVEVYPKRMFSPLVVQTFNCVYDVRV